MATNKVAFTKLNLKVNNSIAHVLFNDQEIEVKQYLPLEGKVAAVSNVVNHSIDDNGYFNPMKVQMYLTLEIVFAYTNISFTEKQKENELKLYDALVSSGLYEAVVKKIPANEFKDICKSAYDTIENIYKFNNSFAGALNAMSADYENLDVNISELQQKMGDPNNLALLKEILTKLG